MVESDIVTQNFALEAIQTYTISGMVTADGTALELATVNVDGTGLSAVTESDGTYTIYDVESGIYDVTASKEGYSSQTDEVTVDSDEVDVNFVLNEISITPLNMVVETDKETYSRPSFAYITVIVTEDDGITPVAGASVSITITDPQSQEVTGSGVTNSVGMIQFKYRIGPKVSTGTYMVTATADLTGHTTGTGTTTFGVA